MYQQYLNVFNLSVTYTEGELKKAFRTSCKKYHPDINPSQDAHEKFIEINEAYEVLLAKLNQPKLNQRKVAYYAQYSHVKARKRAKMSAEDLDKTLGATIGYGVYWFFKVLVFLVALFLIIYPTNYVINEYLRIQALPDTVPFIYEKLDFSLPEHIAYASVCTVLGLTFLFSFKIAYKQIIKG